MSDIAGDNLKGSWIYSLQDEDLISCCNEFKVDLSGTLKECRHRFARFLNAEHKPLRMLRLLELQRKHSKDATNVVSPTKQLKEKIDRRYQRFGESFEHFACELQKLMQELNYSESQQFTIILRNSQPIYQHFIKRKQCSKLHELMMLAGDLEEIRDCMMEQTRPVHNFKQLHYDASHIYATIYVCEIQAIATIDTGASRSFLSEDYVAKLGKRCRYVPVNADVTLADGSVRVLKFAVEGQVRMGNICCQFQFIIMPDASEDIILGLDFCLHVGATFSCGGETIQLKNRANAVVVNESDLNAVEPILERKTTKLSSVVQSSTSSAEKLNGIEESATKTPLSSKRKREESRLQNDKNNKISTPYPTRQRVHPMPLFTDPYTGIPFSSNRNRNVDKNKVKPFSFNPLINFPATQWSQRNNSYIGSNFSNQQCSNEPSWNGPDNNSTNCFLNNQGPNGTGWNGTNSIPNFDNNQGPHSNGWNGQDSSANNFSNNRNFIGSAWNQNKNGPNWNGNEAYIGNNFTNNQGLNSLASNNSNGLPSNNLSNSQGQNLAEEQTRRNRDASFVAPTPNQPLLKTTKSSQEKQPPLNDFSKYDAETAVELHKIVEQASKGDFLLQELSMLQTIRGQLFKILVYRNRRVFIMDVPSAKKNLNAAKSQSSTVPATEKSARTSATSLHIAQNKKSTATNPHQSAKTSVAEDSMEKNTHEIPSVIKREKPEETVIDVLQKATETNETEAIATVEKDTDKFPKAAKRQKTDETQTQASAACSEPNSSTKTTASANNKDKECSEVRQKNQPTNASSDVLLNKPNLHGAEEKKIETNAKQNAAEQENSFSQRDNGEHKVPQLVDKQNTKAEVALVNATHSSLNIKEMPTTTSQKATRMTPSAVPWVDLDLSMYDEETASELRKFALDSAAGQRLRCQISCLREVCGRQFRMVIPKNRKVTFTPLDPKFGGDKDKT